VRRLGSSLRPGFSRGVALPVVIAVAALAGCHITTTSADAGGPPPSARMERTGPNGALSVVLTQLGAQRAGIQTAVAATAAHGRAVVPDSALLYQPDGSSVIYAMTAPLTYTLATVGVASIQGSQVYLTGVKPGTTVVTVGGEELLGVQDGVGVQT
jgi:hypothetical protein